MSRVQLTEHEEDVSCRVLSSKNMLNLNNWKANVDSEIRKLKQRVTLLEVENYDLRQRDGVDDEEEFPSLNRRSLSAAAKAIGFDGGCFEKWVGHLRLTRRARVQCLLLLACLVTFFYCGVHQYIRAKQNHESAYKPEKKIYLKDYEDGIMTNEYEMPYFYFHFYVHLGSVRLEDIDVDSYLPLILGIWDEVMSSSVISYYSSEETGMNETYELLEIEENTVNTASIGYRQNGFWAFYRVKYKKPNPSMGSWYLFLHLQYGLIPVSETLTIDFCIMSIFREVLVFKPFTGLFLQNYDDAVSFYVVSYDESVTNRLDTEDTSELVTNFLSAEVLQKEDIEMHFNLSTNNSDIIISVLPDLQVEYWQEYVEYGYWEWTTTMGGLFTIISTSFFWAAYYIGSCFGTDTKVGILAEMSILYNNLEHVHHIEQILKQNEMVTSRQMVPLVENTN